MEVFGISCLPCSGDEDGVQEELEKLCHGTIQLSRALFQYMALSLSNPGSFLRCSLERMETTFHSSTLISEGVVLVLVVVQSSTGSVPLNLAYSRWCSAALWRMRDLDRSGMVSELCQSWCWCPAISPGEALLHLIFVELGQIDFVLQLPFQFTDTFFVSLYECLFFLDWDSVLSL